MKLTGTIVAVVVAMMFVAPAAFAATSSPSVPNYEVMTTDQLCYADPTFSTTCTNEQRAAFEKEWNKRIQSMSEPDRVKYLGMREAARARYLQGGGDKETGDLYRRDFPAEEKAKK